MAVTHYNLSLLNYKDCRIHFTPEQLCVVLKSWRNGQETSEKCSKCHRRICFNVHFAVCCDKFYYRPTTDHYPVTSIAVKTPGYKFALRCLSTATKHLSYDQEFLILPDPIYWQLNSTLIYEKTMKFVQGVPMTKKTTQILPASRSNVFYRQIEEAPLNHGSIYRRSGGKLTLFRQIAFGKRVTLAMRGMIVPDASLEPNQIALPAKIHDLFGVLGRWVILNRMPSLQPENFIGLKVAKTWKHDCFGIPLEIVEQMNADFDGDECNLYLVPNVQSQAECATLLDPRENMGSFTSGIKLNPSHDMLVCFHLFFDEIHFLPYKDKKSLRRTFRVIYDLYGSQKTYDCVNEMRKFYLDKMQNKIVFGITLKEIFKLIDLATQGSYEDFEKNVQNELDSCLVAQVVADAKGSFYHLYQMFGSVGIQGDYKVSSSFWKGLTPEEAVIHADIAYAAMLRSSKIWEPGYGYSKSHYNLQGLTVDYRGRLMDGRLVVENDILDVLHYTDLMSKDAFLELLRQEIL